MVNYSSSSMYFTTPQVDGHLSYWVPRNIPSSKDDLAITISATYNLRPDLLAHDMYGDARLWWVFAMRNPNTLADEPLNNFVSGLNIFAPAKETIQRVLGIS